MRETTKMPETIKPPAARTLAKTGKIVAVVGSRDFPDLPLVYRTMESVLDHRDGVVSGGARGVDKAAEDCCRVLGLPCEVIPAKWDLSGRSAGILRNAEIVKRATHMIAFWDGESRGTLDSIRRMAMAGKPCTVYVRGHAARSAAPAEVAVAGHDPEREGEHGEGT